MKAYKVTKVSTFVKVGPARAPWRPSWSTLGWGLCWAYLFTACAAPILVEHIVGGPYVAPLTWWDWCVLISTGELYLLLMILFAWLFFKPVPPQPHPFTTQLFWLTLGVFGAVTVPLWFIFDWLGVWSALGSVYNWLGVFKPVVSPAIFGIFWIIRRRLPAGKQYIRPSIAFGITCGLLFAFLIAFISMCVSMTMIFRH